MQFWLNSFKSADTGELKKKKNHKSSVQYLGITTKSYFLGFPTREVIL